MIGSFRRLACAWGRGMRSAGRRSAVVAALVAGAGSGSFAEDVFTVANYPVEARADNAVAAKDRALVEGQQAAFRSLLKRLVSVTAYSHIARLKDFRAGDLIEGVKVRSERNSTTEYFANLDFAFQAKLLRCFDRTVESYPHHYFGICEMLRLPTNLPDTLIRQAPAGRKMIGKSAL